MPKTPLQFRHIGAILGDREDAESLTLEPAYSSDGSRNVYLDKYGRATTILGFTKRNAAAVTSTTGAAAMRLRALYQYGSQSAGVVTRKLLGVFEGSATYELFVSTNGGGTWTSVAELGSGYVSYLPDFAQLGDDLVITFGTGAVKTYDGSTFGNASSTQLAAPTAVSTTNVGLLDGTFQWKIVPVKSDGTRKMASVASVALSVNKKQVTVTWTADSEASVYEVYRTTGTGKVYFFETAIPSGTLTFTSNTADLALIAGRALQEYGDAPPSGAYFVEAHLTRLFYGRTDTYPRRVWPSDPGLPYSVDNNGVFFDFTDDESFTDFYVGGTGNYKGMFVGWLERSIWTVSGQGRYNGPVIDWVTKRSNAQVGTVSHRTVIRVPAGSVYLNAQGETVITREVMLAYLTPLGDVRLFDGNNDTVISWPKQETFKRLAYNVRRKAFAILDIEHNEVVWVFPVDAASEPNYAVAWNLRTGAMIERQWDFASAAVIDTENDSVLIVAGESDTAVGGYCYELWSGYDFDGTAIAPKVATATIYSVDRVGNKKLHEDQQWRWVDLLVKNLAGSVSLLVEVWPTEADLDSPPFASDTLTFPVRDLVTADGSTIVTADGSTIQVAASESVLRMHMKAARTSGNSRYLISRGVRIRVSTTDDGQWALVGMTVAHQKADSGNKKAFRR
jgi:hypothetical protein